MKADIKYLLFGLLALIITSCSSYKEFYIEVLKPSPITIPSDVRNVLFLHNAAPHIDRDSTIVIANEDSVILVTDITLDSLVWKSVYAMVDVFSESGNFNQIDIDTLPIRYDNDFLEIKNLSKDLIKDYFQDYDMLVSIDRFLFIMGKNDEDSVKSEKLNYFQHQVKAAITNSIYIKPRETPLTTFSIVDSVEFQYLNYINEYIIARKVKDIPVDLARDLGYITAAKYFPYWVSSQRKIYKEVGSRMREADSYAGSDKWDKALPIWLSEYQSIKKNEQKAKIASNIALGYEMNNKFSDALEWAKKSQDHFKELKKPDDDKDVSWIRQYVTTLEERVGNNTILDIQLGPLE